MKLGLVLECDTGGPDELVLTCLARRLKPGTVVVPAALGSKAAVFTKGVEAAAKLVEADRCDLALIVWDLKPFWSQVAAKSCVEEVQEMKHQLQSLPAATRKKIKLLCLTHELETWIIADERALSAYLSRETRKVKFPSTKDPASKTDAKAFLNSETVKVRGWRNRYVDYKEAIRIARLWPDTARVKRVESFQRFASLITATKDSDFQMPGDTCNDLAHQASMMGRI
jgi:hypothetical protein